MSDEKDIRTLLVVEDDVLVRITIADYLRECGFRVIDVGLADEAVGVLNSGVQVDLVFSDIQMPGTMNGVGLAQWIRQHRPGLSVILTSGWSDAAAEAGHLCDGGPLVTKPYDHALLGDRIKRVLGTGDGSQSGGAT